MDAYAVLGVVRTQPLDQIEARFRVLLHETHPDLYGAAGPSAVADAERRTRLLTEAMAQIRDDYASAASSVVVFGDPREPTASGAWTTSPAPTSAGPVPSATRRPRDPVACPHCGQGFVQLADFELHLATEHEARPGSLKRKGAGPPQHRRSGRGSRRLERMLETIAVLVAVLAAVGATALHDPITEMTGPWMRPVLALTVLLCLFLAGGILFFRR